MKAIYFDMDGTIADLYGVDNWEPKLRAEDVTPYTDARPMYDMAELNSLMNSFVEIGITVGVISWSSMGGSANYNREVRRAKMEWINRYLPCVSEFHVVKYGTPKHKVRKIEDSILVDDNQNVRDAWQGMTIDATKNILEELKNLLALATE